VKKSLYLLLAAATCFCLNLNAQVDTQDTGAMDIEPSAAALAGEPFKLDLNGDYVSNARVKNCPHMGNVVFATGSAELNFIYYYDLCYKEGAAVAFVYQQTYLNYSKNPFFNQKNFDTATLLFSTFTERLDDWQWRAQVAINFDDLPYWNFSDYMNYDILAWGRYAFYENLGLHIGFWVQTGMEFDRVYPIIGIDWKCGDWAINAVFPVDLSVVYTINDEWNIALAGRFIDQRHRAKRDEPVREAFWHYQSGGAELALNYNPIPTVSINVHGGYSFGGHLTICNQHYHRLSRLKLGDAPYGGAEIAVHF